MMHLGKLSLNGYSLCGIILFSICPCKMPDNAERRLLQCISTESYFQSLLLAVPTYDKMLRESFKMIVMKLLKNVVTISTMCNSLNSSISTY